MKNKIINIECETKDYIEISEINDIQGDLKNITKKREEKLKQSIIENGICFPFHVWEKDNKYYSIDGKHRKTVLEKLEKDGYEIPKIPCVKIKAKNEKEAKKMLLLASSQYAKIDKNYLKESFLEEDVLKSLDIEINIDGINIDNMFDIDIDLNDMSDELDGAFQLKDKVKFDSNNFWNVPEIDKSKLISELDFKNLITYCNQELDESKQYVYIYGSDKKNRNLNIPNSILCFYTDDYRFEKIWVDPVKQVTRLINLGFKKAMGVNFSIYRGESRAFHLLNVYKSRWCTRYLQMAGFDIIPDINYADEESYEYCLYGMPVGADIYSIQMQTLSDQDDQRYFRKGLEYMLDKLKPKNIILYCSRGKEEDIKYLDFGNTNYYILYNRASTKKYGGNDV